MGLLWVLMVSTTQGQLSIFERLKQEEEGAPAQEQTEGEESAPTAKPAESAKDKPKADAAKAEDDEEADDDAPKPVRNLKRLKPDDTFAPAYPAHDGSEVKVIVIPIHGPIDTPTEYIMRRAAKKAIAEQADVVILDLDTPGGRMDVMLEVMDRLLSYEGTTIAYVNNEAISAGAYIALAANEIWYAPHSVIGAAEAITSMGGDIEDGGMKRKLDSYIDAKIRATQADHPHKADVMRAMTNHKFVLERDGTILNQGQLLSLTDDEALARYGEPPTPLFGEGRAKNVEDLLNQRFGEGNWTIDQYQVTAAETVGQYLVSISGLILTVGLVMIFIEFKTPGFGLIGWIGACLVAVFFASQYIAGLAGYEPLFFFLVGLVLLVVELFVIPGFGIAGILGIAFVLGGLGWAMVDIWPSQTSPTGLTVSTKSLAIGLWQLIGSLTAAILLMVVFFRNLKYLPFYRDVVLQAPASGTVTGQALPANAGHEGGSAGIHPRKRPGWPELGTTGKVTRILQPVGEVEIAGKRFEAASQIGMIAAGTAIRVIDYGTFNLIVEPDES